MNSVSVITQPANVARNGLSAMKPVAHTWADGPDNLRAISPTSPAVARLNATWTAWIERNIPRETFTGGSRWCLADGVSSRPYSGVSASNGTKNRGYSGARTRS